MTDCDFPEDNLVSIKKACKMFPGPKTLSLTTINRWVLHGIRGVKLESIKIGGRRYTTKAAIDRFIEQTNTPEPQSQHAIQSPSKWKQSLKQVDHLLDKEGF